jgi:hypothetical protein
MREISKICKVRYTEDIHNSLMRKAITKNKWYDVLWRNEYGFTFINDSGDLSLGKFKNCSLINNNWEINYE